MDAMTNRPTVADLYNALAPDFITPIIDDQFAPLKVQTDILLASFGRFDMQTVAGIQTEDIAKRSADLIKKLKVQVSDVEAARVAIKAPVKAASDQIDGKGREQTKPLVDAASTAQKRLDAYMKAKDAETRRVAAEEAARKDAEAQTLVDSAVSNAEEATRLVAQAEEAAAEAALAFETATAPTPDLSRLRGNLATASLHDDWKIEVVNIKDIPAELLMLNEKAAMAIIRAQAKRKQVPHIDGLVIRNEPKAIIR